MQKDILVGTRVRWVTFEKGEDHGHPTEWGFGHSGTIVKVRDPSPIDISGYLFEEDTEPELQYLCEEDNGTRMWVDKVILETDYIEREAAEAREMSEFWKTYKPKPNSVVSETS